MGVDDLSTGSRANVPPGVVLHEFDICDPITAKVIREFRPDVLCHHAAQIDVRRSVEDPVGDAQVNIVGSLALFETCRAAGCHRVVFASSGGAVYGEQDCFPADETHPPRPLSPYGVAKLAVENYLQFYERQHGFQVVNLRYANVYGPRQSPRGEAGVIAIFADRLLRGTPAIIHGDGQQTRDFVYVGDVAHANVLAIHRDSAGIYNVGTGVETSVSEIFDHLRAQLAPLASAIHGAAVAGEQRRSCLASQRLQTALGWEARTQIATGLAITAAWFRGARESIATPAT